MTPPRQARVKKGPVASCFPANLRNLRGTQSQVEFAEWLLVSQQTLSFWERGKRHPSRRAWALLEQRLGYPQTRLEGEVLSRQSAVADAHSAGRTIALPPLPDTAAGLRVGLEGLTTEALGMAELQRALREALRAKRPVWLVVG